MVGDELADVGVHAARDGEEDAAIGGDQGLLAEDVLEDAGAAVLLVARLRHLGELEGIADQDHALACAGGGNDRVGEAVLAGLVDDEVVDLFVQRGACAQPARAGEELDATFEGVVCLRRARDLLDLGEIRVVLLVRIALADEVEVAIRSSLLELHAGVANGGVGWRRQRHRVAVLHERHDELRREPRLARAGWALHGERSSAQAERSLAYLLKPGGLLIWCAAVGLLDVDVAGRTVDEGQFATGDRQRAGESVVAPSKDDVAERVEHGLLAFMGEELGGGEVVNRATVVCRSKAYDHLTCALIDGDDRDVAVLGCVEVPRRVRGLVILRGIRVERLAGSERLCRFDGCQAGEDARVVESLPRRHVDHLGELAPAHAIFALVVVEERGDQPCGIVVGIELANRIGDLLARYGCGVALFGFLALLILLARLDRPGWTVRPQPLGHGQRGAAVFLVVVGDSVEQRLIYPGILEPVFVEHHGVATAIDVGLPLEARELLDVLESIRLGTDPQPLAHDGVEIDEQLALAQLLELLECAGVGLGDRAQHRRLGVGVVVDAHVRECLAARLQEVDELAVASRLLDGIVRPERAIHPTAVVALLDPAEQEDEAAVGTPDRITFEVEVDVAGRWLGQELEAAGGLAHAMLPLHALCLNRAELDRGLCRDLGQRVLLDARHARLCRQRRERRQRCHRRLVPGEVKHVRATDPRDERWVVVFAPLLLARRPMRADGTVRVRVGDGLRRLLDEALEARLLRAGVVDHLEGADRLAQPRPELDMDMLGQRALDRGDRIRIERELQDVVGEGIVACELRVDRLVAPVAEIGLARNLLEEVGDSAPARQREVRLIDDLRTRPHRLERERGRALLTDIVLVHTRDSGDPRLIERGEIRVLVLATLARD